MSSQHYEGRHRQAGPPASSSRKPIYAVLVGSAALVISAGSAVAMRLGNEPGTPLPVLLESGDTAPASSSTPVPAARNAITGRTARTSPVPTAGPSTVQEVQPSGIGAGTATTAPASSRARAAAQVPAGSATPVALSAARKKITGYAWHPPVTRGRVTSGFGTRWGRAHEGVDFAAPEGTPLYAVGSGEVTFTGWSSGYGNKIELTLDDGTEVHYAHLSSIDVEEGEEVTTGEFLGEVGNTGRSTGAHLHFEVRPGGEDPIDPIPWLRKRAATP